MFYRKLWLITCIFLTLVLSGIKGSGPAMDFENARAGERFFSAFGSADYEASPLCVEAANGNLFTCGITDHATLGYTDFMMSMHDSAGNLLRCETFGSVGTDSILTGITATSDGGFAATGGTDYYDSGDVDLCFFKLDSSGDLQWFDRMGGAAGDFGYGIQETTDNGLVVCGYTSSYGAGGSDGLVIKCNSSGSPLWWRVYGGTDNESLRGLEETSDGGYIVTGYTASHGVPGIDNLLAMKLDAAGNVTWSTVIYGSGQIRGQKIVQTADGGYALVAISLGIGPGGSDIILSKLSGSGAVLWTSAMGTTCSDWVNSLIETQDNGLLLSYTTTYCAGDPALLCLAKFDANGYFSWARSYGGVSEEKEGLVSETENGDLLLAGRTMSYGAGGCDSLLIRTDSNGLIPGCPVITTESLTIVSPSVTAVSVAIPSSVFAFSYAGTTPATTSSSPATTWVCFSQYTATPTPTATETPAPSTTPTVTSTATPLPTSTQTPLPSVTPTPSSTPTATVTSTPSATPTPRPVPVTGPVGLGLLLTVMGLVLGVLTLRPR